MRSARRRLQRLKSFHPALASLKSPLELPTQRMGRTYSVEMQEVEQTYRESVERQLDKDAVDTVKPLLRYPLVACGVGGSTVAAEFIAHLHRVWARQPARAATTFDVYTDGVLPSEAALVVSAGGRNKDALRALERIITCDPAEFGVVTANPAAPLAKLANHAGTECVLDIGTGRRKDGYLATNTLLATCLSALRLYAQATGHELELPGSLEALLGATVDEWQKEAYERLAGIENRSNVLVLHAGWGRVGGVDQESRLHEAGLWPTQVVDVRNFAHGRHYWPERHADTLVLAFSDADQASLADRTLGLLPSEVDRIHLTSSRSGPIAGIEHLVKSMLIVGQMAKRIGVDPGRPKVPHWGRKIYSLGPGRKPKFPRGDPISIGPFRGIVLDFDGTCIRRNQRFRNLTTDDPLVVQLVRLLEAGLIIGLASGRGKSLWNQLAPALPASMHDQVVLGYYNGGIVRSMAEGPIERPSANPARDLDEIRQFLEKLYEQGWLQDLVVRANQVGVRPINPSDHDRLVNAVKAEVHGRNLRVKIATSSLGLDCFPEAVSKLHIVNEVATRRGCSQEDVLRIGDRADVDGNDFELLNHPMGLSVDRRSEHPERGQAPLRPWLRGSAATELLLRRIQVRDGMGSLHVEANSER